MASGRAALHRWCLVALAVSPIAVASPPSGLIHMPDARPTPDGTLHVGASIADPYAALWSRITLAPFLDVTGRFTRIADTEPFVGLGYGAHKDKAFDARVQLYDGRGRWPAIAAGVDDFVGDHRMFRARWFATTYLWELGAMGELELTAGYGTGRIDGAFGGARWLAPGGRWAAAVEWDAHDYAADFYPSDRVGGPGVAVEYANGPWWAQLSRQRDRWGASIAVAMPLQQRALVPRVDEPPPYPIAAPAPWSDAPTSLRPLFRALAAEGFSDIQLSTRGDTVRVTASERRMTMLGRAAGRAARLIAAHAPADVTALELTLTDFRLPLATYRFEDLALVRGYFEGTVTGEALAASASVAYTSAAGFRDAETGGAGWADVFGPDPRRLVVSTGSPLFGLPLSVHRPGARASVLRVQPFRANVSFNDPNGVLRHDVYTRVSFTQWLARRSYLHASARITLHEDISRTVAQSNSTLPRVRSDVGRYRRDGDRARLQSLYASHLVNPADRVYAWLSAGLLEEMFAGVGGEVLYLPERGRWAVDFAAYAVRQRDYEGWFGSLDYETVTALVSHHYRVPAVGATVTTRVGRFLAGDLGARFEFKRRFESGFEVGAWYSVTDARDETSPGRPGNPYRDKGIFVRVALGPFLTRDNAAGVEFSLAPWARDPGQMVRAPGNLYAQFERRLMLNLDSFSPWSDFGH